MNNPVYIGLDDTDILGEPPGTGRVARELARHLEKLGLGKSFGVSRHQLLVDPRIRYTSHNSSLCIGMNSEADLSAFMTPCVQYVESHSKPGSDPGLCLVSGHSIAADLVDFGWRATREVLEKEAATTLAERHSIFLKELGGTGEGIIGALAAVALRADGNQGRFVDLRGIRSISGVISAGALKTLTDIQDILGCEGTPIGDEELIETYDWVRPSMHRGRVVLRVQPLASKDGPAAWEPVENRKGKPKKKKED